MLLLNREQRTIKGLLKCSEYQHPKKVINQLQPRSLIDPKHSEVFSDFTGSTLQQQRILCNSRRRWRGKKQVPVLVSENMMSHLQRKNAKLCLFRVLAKHHSMLRACSVASDSLPPHDCSLPGPSAHGIVPPEILQGAAISSSRDLLRTQGSNPSNWLLYCRWILYSWATREVLSCYTGMQIRRI